MIITWTYYIRVQITITANRTKRYKTGQIIWIAWQNLTKYSPETTRRTTNQRNPYRYRRDEQHPYRPSEVTTFQVTLSETVILSTEYIILQYQ